MMRAEYRLEPCKSALNRVKGMAFKWSLNPYMGCMHQCTFCYVRHFELRADRPYDERYGHSIRVKTNVAEVLRQELARASWQQESVAIGAATDPYQPVEGRFRLTRACLVALADAGNPFSLITRGPLAVRDVDVLQDASARADVSITFSIPTLDEEVWRKTEPGTPPPRSRLEAVRRLSEAGIDVGVGMAPILPGLSDRPLGERTLPAAGDARALSRGPRPGLARTGRALRGALRRSRVPSVLRDEAGQGSRPGARPLERPRAECSSPA
jgi:DNA repair photolyase